MTLLRRRVLVLGALAALPILLGLAIVLAKRVRMLDDREAKPIGCSLDGLEYSHGALVRVNERVIKCHNGRWITQ